MLNLTVPCSGLQLSVHVNFGLFCCGRFQLSFFRPTLFPTAATRWYSAIRSTQFRKIFPRRLKPLSGQRWAQPKILALFFLSSRVQTFFSWSCRCLVARLTALDPCKLLTLGVLILPAAPPRLGRARWTVGFASVLNSRAFQSSSKRNKANYRSKSV